MTGIGGMAGGMSRLGEDDLDLDMGEEPVDDMGDGLDLDLDDEGADDLGDDVDLDDLGGGGDDAIEVECPDCGSTITVRLVPEVEAGDGLDMGGDEGLDDMGGLDDLGEPEAGPDLDLDAGGPSERECYESVDPRAIAKLLTDDPDIFTS